jgi:hypothetical protein
MRILSKKNERTRKWKAQNKAKTRKYGQVYNWRIYGINLTYERYLEMLAGQNGLCAICCRPPGKKSLAPDHDHQTGKVRALLCSKCNCGLGCLNDDSGLLRRAAEYLDRHSS